MNHGVEIDISVCLLELSRFCNQEYAPQNAFCRAHLVTAPFRRVWCWCCDYSWVCLPQSLLPLLSRAWALRAGGTFWSLQPRILWLQRACTRNNHCAGPSVAETSLSSPCSQCGNKDDQACYSDRRSWPVAGCSRVPATLWKLCPSTLCLPPSHQLQPWGELKSWV